MNAPRLVTALVACALLAVAASPASAAVPPVPGRGYGLPLRTVDGLDDVRAAIVTDDGILTAALGPGGVVRIDREGKRETLVPWWPAGGIAEAVALALAKLWCHRMDWLYSCYVHAGEDPGFVYSQEVLAAYQEPPLEAAEVVNSPSSAAAGRLAGVRGLQPRRGGKTPRGLPAGGPPKGVRQGPRQTRTANSNGKFFSL
jgi:hypothetical protein